MKQPSTLVLRAAIMLLGFVVLAICLLGLPRIIGTFDVSGYDPILLGLYLPAIPFFIALYQAMKILSLIDAKCAFTKSMVSAFKSIKLSAIAISSLFAAGMPYIFYVANKDDAPGVVAIALLIISVSFVIGMFASVMQKLIQNAVDLKAENDLTV